MDGWMVGGRDGWMDGGMDGWPSLYMMSFLFLLFFLGKDWREREYREVSSNLVKQRI